MFSILIVDDEIAIREGMMAFDWQAWGFQAAASASTGQKALQILKERPIDLVITDIRMPVMDGLELARRIKAQYPDTLTMILSGYREFEYAQTALQHGVFDYLLKPVDMRKYEQLFARAHAHLQSRRHEEDRLRHVFPLATEKVLADLLGGAPVNPARLRYLSGAAALPLSECRYGVILISPAPSPQREDFAGRLPSLFPELPGAALWHEGMLALLFAVPSAEGDARLSKAAREIPRLFPASAAAVGPSVPGLAQVSASYQGARKLLARRAFLKSPGQVFTFPLTPPAYPQREEDALLSAVEGADAGGMEASLLPYLAALYDFALFAPLETPENGGFEEEVSGFLEKVGLIANRYGLALDKFGFSPPYAQFAARHQTAPELSAALLHGLRPFLLALSQARRASAPTAYLAVRQVLEYIDAHYDQKITLAAMARRVYLNASYFSVLFKKETGKNFIDHLTDVRMAKAKELLAASKQRIYEIAWQTGYQNPRYFTDSFRKYTGMSPQEYRQLAGGDAANAEDV